ncbi:unnamed protein product [Somion occarium]|uniref:Uncharacterized protein n=1 Tax=Somion occarium TaxID=3059160 RepID=A0ABP1DG65_9APHY
MHKNPFAVPSSYTPQQPPLPPGPPPPQPAQPDYSAYWAAAAAAQPNAYTPQWSAGQPAQAAARPTPEQSALYANYGYGPGQQNWQQQQQRQAQPYQPPPPVAQPPPPPPPQATYNPYQPQTVAYQQPYIPQAAPQHVPHQPQYQPPVVQAPPQFQQQHQPYFGQQQPHQQQQQQQQNRQQHNRNQNLHQQSSQHLPPAKRQRFGPAQSQGQIQHAPPTQPAQSGAIGGGVGVGVGAFQGPGGGRGGGPGANQVPLGGSRGGFGGGRGGNAMGGRGRGGPMGMNRGGSRGRGGGFNNMGNRGPSQSGGSFRGHGSHRGFGNRDNRRGGSFNTGGQGFAHGQQQQQQHHQGFPSGGTSFRGRHGPSHAGRGGRHDTVAPHGPKDSTASTSVSVGKKEENRRTLTDFKIVGLELRDLSWSWGVIPPPSESDVKEERTEAEMPSAEEPASEQKPNVSAASDAATHAAGPSTEGTTAATEKDTAVVKSEITTAPMPPPPSRIRIYFHTPVTADDIHSLTPQSSLSLVVPSDSAVRKGKRKKLDDDDADIEDGRGPPPPPPGMDHDSMSIAPSVDRDGTETLAGRDSMAPSVAETTSEGEVGQSSQATELEEPHDEDADADAIGEEYVEGEGYEIHEDVTMGSIDDHHTDAHFESGPNEVLGSNGHPDQSHELPSPNDANGVYDSSESVESMLKASGPSEATEPTQSSSQSPHDLNDSSSNLAVGAVSADSEAPDSLSNVPQTQPEGKNTDTDTFPESQVPAQPNGTRRPLQAMDSLASTVPDTNGQEDTSPYTSTVLEGSPVPTAAQEDAQTQPVERRSSETQHNQVELGTPSTSTAVSGLNGTPASQVHAKSDVKLPSANRLSISYAAGTRRMVIDAEVVDKLVVRRDDGRIEVHLNIARDDGSFKGIMVEAFSDSSSSYTPLDIAIPNLNDPTIPPFNTASLPLKTVLIAYLDKERPLSEPKWVKTGDVQEWLKTMFGRMFWAAGDAADGWEKKIEVADPDPVRCPQSFPKFYILTCVYIASNYLDPS